MEILKPVEQQSQPASSLESKPCLWWVRYDVRTHDNAVLQAAAQRSSAVLPVYIFNTSLMGDASSRTLKLPLMSPRRAQFFIEAVEVLRSQMKKLFGLDVVVRFGSPAEELAIIASETNIKQVFVGKETNVNEIKEEEAVREKGLVLHTIWNSTLLHIEDLPLNPVTEYPPSFSQFRKAVEGDGVWKVRPLIEIPEKIQKVVYPEEKLGAMPDVKTLTGQDCKDKDQRAVINFVGGEISGQQRVKEYFWEKNCLYKYKQTRNDMTGDNYSTKFSAWLAQGSLSPRYIYYEIKEYERKRVKNISTYWLVYELLWRDYFWFLPMAHGDLMFALNGPRNFEKPWRWDANDFEKWSQGNTGYPIIDANMRELVATGYMSNRGRQITASFLTKDLGLDWRWGAEFFDLHLIDSNPALNYGNWTYSAGVGTDAREDRYFNIIKQGRAYDAGGFHSKKWLPFLKNVPRTLIHTPWLLTVDQRKEYGVPLDYGQQETLCPRELGKYIPSGVAIDGEPIAQNDGKQASTEQPQPAGSKPGVSKPGTSKPKRPHRPIKGRGRGGRGRGGRGKGRGNPAS
eukprot:m.54711 g.54711  ORF g.54711 m.54711 type:complete len:569 (-) comp10944_c0_seq2:1527-3233(-)